MDLECLVLADAYLSSKLDLSELFYLANDFESVIDTASLSVLSMRVGKTEYPVFSTCCRLVLLRATENIMTDIDKAVLLHSAGVPESYKMKLLLKMGWSGCQLFTEFSLSSLPRDLLLKSLPSLPFLSLELSDKELEFFFNASLMRGESDTFVDNFAESVVNCHKHSINKDSMIGRLLSGWIQMQRLEKIIGKDNFTIFWGKIPDNEKKSIQYHSFTTLGSLPPLFTLPHPFLREVLPRLFGGEKASSMEALREVFVLMTGKRDEQQSLSPVDPFCTKFHVTSIPAEKILCNFIENPLLAKMRWRESRKKFKFPAFLSICLVSGNGGEGWLTYDQWQVVNSWESDHLEEQLINSSKQSVIDSLEDIGLNRFVISSWTQSIEKATCLSLSPLIDKVHYQSNPSQTDISIYHVEAAIVRELKYHKVLKESKLFASLNHEHTITCQALSNLVERAFINKRSNEQHYEDIAKLTGCLPPTIDNLDQEYWYVYIP